MAEAVQTPRERRQNRGFILGSLSLGHGISHLYDQGFSVFLTAIAQSLGLTNFQVAALLGIRQGGFGVVNLGGGVFVDRARSNWGPILTFCMLWSALAFVAIAASPNLAILIVAVSMVSIPGALWHLPATAALSRRFPDRRGFAISIHGFGSNVGNVLGPLLAGVLLSYLLWRHVLYLYAIPAVIMTIFVWWSLRELGNEGEEERDAGRRMGAQVRDGLRLLRNPVVMALAVAAAIRGVATGAMFNWAPFYLESTEFGGLGMSYILTGVHVALLTGMGVVSTPILGYLSDRYGRKTVLAPGLAAAAVLTFFVVGAGDTIFLALLMCGVGLFSFALQQIILAAVLDVVEKGTEATASGLIFGFNGVLGFGSPFLATLIIQNLGGYGSIFYYSAIMTVAALALVLVVPFPDHRQESPRPA